jgi:hypothetical protein
VGRVCHPVDLPEGYHAVPGGKPGKLSLWLEGMLPPGHRMVGRRQADGTPHGPQRARPNSWAVVGPSDVEKY